MSYGPRYITATDVVNRTAGKVPYDLVPTLPQPNTVVINVDGSQTLGWTTIPANWLLLSSHQTGAIVTQGGVFGQYGGTVPGSGFKIVVLAVDGIFLTTGGVLTLIPDPNSISLAFLNELIAQAEAEVEVDLNPIYVTPFIGVNGETFNNLPAQSHNYLKLLFSVKSAEYVMSTEFVKVRMGEGADSYPKQYVIWYTSARDRLFGRAKTGNLMTFPLDGLQTNTQNLQLPLVTIPKVFNDNLRSVEYAKCRINDPAITTFGLGYGAYPFSRR